MRDPKRIADVLKVLEKVWREEPDLRLGQIIVNATKARSSGRQIVCPEIFYIEDDNLLSGIEELAKMIRNPQTGSNDDRHEPSKPT